MTINKLKLVHDSIVVTTSTQNKGKSFKARASLIYKSIIKGWICGLQLTMASDNEKQPIAIQETTPDQNQEEQPPTCKEAVLDDDIKRHMEEWKKVAEERPLRVMVCGLGGVGKSTLINRLLQLEGGEKWAEEGRSGGATTSVVMQFEKITKSGIKICLFDTPGFGDIDITDEKIIAMMEKETEKRLDVFFYCISLEGAARVQQPDVTAIQRMTQAFSHEIWKKAVVVFTFANVLEEKKNNADEYWSVIERIKEKIKETLRKLTAHS